MNAISSIMTILGLKRQATTVSNDTPRKVLIVEDDVSLAGALKDAFTDAGFEVLHADNGRSGLDIANSQKPDVILLDLIMPVMNGKVMLRKLREIPQCKSLPVIVLTNAGQADNIRETVELDDAVEFLIKSNVTLDEIVAKVKRSH